MSNSNGSFLGGMGMEEPNIDLSEYQNTKCECGCETFIPTVIFKQISQIIVGENYNRRKLCETYGY